MHPEDQELPPPATEEPLRPEDQEPPEQPQTPARSGSGGCAGAALGFILGYVVGLGLCRLQLSGAGFEHGGPGVGAYIVVQLLIAPLFFGLLGAMIGAFAASTKS